MRTPVAVRHGGPAVKGIYLMNRPKNRSYLMGVVGGYLLYLAWQLFDDRNNPDSTMAVWLNITFAAFFVIVGIGLMIFAFRIWRIADREEREGKTEVPPADEKEMK